MHRVIGALQMHKSVGLAYEKPFNSRLSNIARWIEWCFREIHRHRQSSQFTMLLWLNLEPNSCCWL